MHSHQSSDFQYPSKNIDSESEFVNGAIKRTWLMLAGLGLSLATLAVYAIGFTH